MLADARFAGRRRKNRNDKKRHEAENTRPKQSCNECQILLNQNKNTPMRVRVSKGVEEHVERGGMQ